MTKEQEDLLTRAKLILLRQMPYFGTFIIGMELIEDTNIPTAATDYYTIRYNPNFVMGGGPDGRALRDVDEVLFILAHEVLHISFKHGIRMGFRDSQLWNVACLVKGTPITMADGSIVPIEKVRGGSFVASPMGPNKVHLVTRAIRKDMVELCLSDGRKVTSTNEHLFLTPEGFLPAGQINQGTDVIMDRRIQGLCVQELPRHDVAGTILPSRLHVSADGIVSPVFWAASEETLHSCCWFGSAATKEADRVGLSGGNSGWRGNYFHRERESEGQEVLSTACDDNHHVTRTGGLGGEDRSIRLQASEHERTALLESYGFRLGDRSVVAWDAAVFDDQETARRVALDLHQNSAEAAERLCQFARIDKAVLADQGYEHARITHIRPYTETSEVFDLVTEHHCYQAAGVVVHNCDYAINLILHDGEVGKFITFDPKLDKDFVKLLDEKFRDMSAETIYDLLEKQHKQQGGGSKLKMGGGVVIDLSKADPGGTGGFSKPTIDGSDLTPAQREMLERAIDSKTSAAAAAAKSQGKLPAGLERFLKTALEPVVDWRSRLRQFVAKQFPADMSWAKPNRRFVWQDLYLPHQEKSGVGKILFIMDTSGSVDYSNPKSEGAQYYAEGKAIHEDVMPEELHVMYCDAAVAGHDVYRPGEDFTLKPRGGGGTDFRPPFKKAAELGLEIQCAVYLTDMMGTFPDKPPPYPVLWVATTDIKAPFGETIRIMK